MMNKDAYRFLAALGLGLLLSEARAEYWTVDELVKDFNQVSAQIARGELQTAEASLDAVSQRAAANDVRIGQYQRELASAYLQQGRQQLQAGDARGAAATLAQGERHLQAASPALKQQYQAVTAQAGGATPAVAPVARKEPAPERPQPVAAVPAAAAPENAEARRDEIERRLREAEAIIARKEAERARQQQLAEEKAAAEREAAQQAAAAAEPEPEPEPAAALVPVAAKLEAPAAVADNAPQARLIDPSAVSSSVPMPMLDANDRDSLRALLDQVAADVVAFDCAVRLEVREAKDYPFVAALLSARIKKLDPGFAPQFSPVLKPDQEPRLVLSPQSNG